MPKSERQTNQRYMEDAVNNVNWAIDKVAQLGMKMLEANKYYQENNLPVPEANQIIIQGLETATETATLLIEIFNNIKDMI